MRENYSTPEPSKLSKKQVFNFAEYISNKLAYNYNGNDIEKCIAKLGGSVQTKEFWEGPEKEGALKVRGRKDFDIFIPQHTSIERDRFTIAHELGHYFIHYLFVERQDERPFYATRYGNGRAEWEANWFAAGFLMPEEEFRKKYKELNSNLNSVAVAFGVSLPAAKVRKEDLDL